jgi:hypothetical protein
MNALSYLTVLPETQSEIKNFAEQIFEGIEPRQALPLLARLTAIEKLAKTIKDGIKEMLMEEASLYGGEKSFEIDGVRFTKTERKSYHYNHCAKWRELTEQIEAIEKHMQIGDWVDPDTGEVVPQATISFSEFITVNLKK